MINLLPPEVREDISYARKNTLLLRWVALLIIVIIGIFIVVFMGQLYINQSSKSYASQIEDAQNALKVQKLEETQEKVKGISSSIKLAVDVLSRQLLFSSILRQIGAAVPEGAVLTGLSIDKVEGGIDLSAAATDYNTATQVQLNLQDPNNMIFEKADIVNVQCNTPSGAVNATTGVANTSQLDILYPCKITVRALFAKNNSFLLINKGNN